MGFVTVTAVLAAAAGVLVFAGICGVALLVLAVILKIWPTMVDNEGDRDMGLERGDLVSFEKDGVIYTDYVGAVTRDPLKRAQAMLADIEKTLAGLGLEPWAPLTWRQRIWRRIRQIIRR